MRTFGAKIVCYLLLLSVLAGFAACGAKRDATDETKNTVEAVSESEESKKVETEREPETETVKETDPSPDLHNLFDSQTASVGWVNGKGDTSPDGSFYTSDFIEVDPGDVVEFGAAVTYQGWHLVQFDYNQNPIGEVTTATGLEILEAIDDVTALMTYTVPDGVGYVRLVCDAHCMTTYIVTVNEPFTTKEFAAYFGLSLAPKETVAPKTDSPLYGKTALFAGDSICYGSWDDLQRRAWAGRIAEQYGMEAVNSGIGGTCMSTVRGSEAQIVNQLHSNKNKDFDFVILEGGVNDAWGTVDGTNRIASPGTVSESFSLNDFDTSSFAGGLEQLFFYATNYWPDAVIGYMFTFYMPNATGIGHVDDMEEYWQVAISICNKWGIKYLDMYHDPYVSDTLMEVTTNHCLRDPIHPNVLGYDRLAPFIGEWMERIS